MATRPIVSYDDITLPYTQDSQPSVKPPPAKKRKRNNHKRKQVDAHHQNSHRSIGPNASNLDEENEGEYEEESRELNHEEIWDDSALVDAWEAAQQEYEMYHGNTKDWQNEPLKKSPLWYNVPVEQTINKMNGASSAKAPAAGPHSSASNKAEQTESDSQPLNFDTFVPTHDPSLHIPAVDTPNYEAKHTDGVMVSQDEAFSRAMNAMYWGGYWTAMYHCQRYVSNHDSTMENKGEDEVDISQDDESDNQIDFVSTQR